MKILKPFDGQHCETTATGTLIHQLDIQLSEPMLFGLGEDLGFIFWNMKTHHNSIREESVFFCTF
ncbi:BtrH N-terminal domain-containing protein [Pedobacter gandavensis]|uniref:BtrH N-terminal domain-containing protein n=1 Tax=Pedobacter gandavensis TaxID=2679963 RepID=UPI00292D8C38|nr:BtrH N-terminal domain-containing protein [Pedobacter gandavensis]